MRMHVFTHERPAPTARVPLVGPRRQPSPPCRRYRPTAALTLKTINPYLEDNGAAVDCSQAHADYDLCYNRVSLFSGAPAARGGMAALVAGR